MNAEMNTEAFARRLREQGTERYVIGGLRAPAALTDGDHALPTDAENLASFDLLVAGGRIEALLPPGAARDAIPAGDRLVLPCFADIHTHLDMGHVIDVAPNPEGTHFGAVKARDTYRAAAIGRGAAWREADLERRMEFGLRCAYAHGTSALRTHLDSLPEQAELSWRVFTRLRERWRGRIELQGVALLPVDHFLGDYGRMLADRVAACGGVLGAVTRLSGEGHRGGGEQMSRALTMLLQLAAERQLDVDLHVDETGDPGATNLDVVARAVLDTGFKRRVVCGHCCSLSARPQDEAQAAINLCRDAGIAIVSLPHVNLFLQDRAPTRTPRWRGVTLLHELRAAGVPVMLATDNVRDYFYAYGDHDLIAVFSTAALVGQLDRPWGAWPAAITRTPASIMGLRDAGVLRAGASADLVIFPARSYSELLSRPQSERLVLRAGRVSDSALPGYGELDEDVF
jgi:cytosine deaminase